MQETEILYEDKSWKNVPILLKSFSVWNEEC